MSRNVDVLTEFEREREVGSGVRAGASAGQFDGQIMPPVGAVGKPAIVRLVRNIFITNKVDAPHKVTFMGIDDDNSSSSVCVTVGRTLVALTGKPVCLVDGNIDLARMSHSITREKMARFPEKLGAACAQCLQIDSNLWLAPPAVISDSRGSLLQQGELNDVLIQLGRAFDYILIDAPGTHASSDAESLGLAADGAVLVVDAHKTRRSATAESTQRLDVAGVRLLGTVLNNRTFPIPERLFRLL